MKNCNLSFISGWYAIYKVTFILFVGIMVVCLYIGTLIRFRITMNKILPTAIDQYAIQQRSLTVTLGLSTLSTLVLFIGPYSVFAVAAYIGVTPPEPTLLGTLSRFSTIVNSAILVIKQKDIRESLRKIFRLKRRMRSAVFER